jgi:peptidoglycan/xylan/chitin deacetylase (PgdA/CDA1 family)
MYHNIIDSNNSSRRISIRQNKNGIDLNSFRKQMKYLFDNKYKVVSVTEFYQKILKNEVDEKNTVVLTFDDGYTSFVDKVYPVLREYCFNATIFTIVNKIGRENYLRWEDLRYLRTEGIDIQSHTMSHRPLEILNDKEIRGELELSKKGLESELKARIDFVSVPQGSFNSKIVKIAREVGYLACLTSENELFGVKSDWEYVLGRIAIIPQYDLGSFAKIVNCNRYLLGRIYIISRLKNGLKRVIGLENYLKLYTRYYRIDDGMFSRKSMH